MAVLSNFQNNSQSVEDDISLHPGVNAAHSDPHSSDAVLLGTGRRKCRPAREVVAYICTAVRPF